MFWGRVLGVLACGVHGLMALCTHAHIRTAATGTDGGGGGRDGLSSKQDGGPSSSSSSSSSSWEATLSAFTEDPHLLAFARHFCSSADDGGNDGGGEVRAFVDRIASGVAFCGCGAVAPDVCMCAYTNTVTPPNDSSHGRRPPWRPGPSPPGPARVRCTSASRGANPSCWGSTSTCSRSEETLGCGGYGGVVWFGFKEFTASHTNRIDHRHDATTAGAPRPPAHGPRRRRLHGASTYIA